MTDSRSSSGHRPGIVAPVMRQLHVADIATSVAFYRDVLGFSATPVGSDFGFGASAELVSGPARIQLAIGSAVPTDRAIGYFQTDDVTALHSAITSRGGNPSAIEKVNWLKIRMFEIRDPTGNVLWFGQSYHEISPRPNPGRQLRQALPNLPLSSVPAGVAYYRDILGFRVNYAQDDIGVMDRDDVTLVLIARTEEYRGIGSCYFYIEDADRLYAELVAKGANVQGQPVSLPWGLREFRIRDLENNQIGFGQTFE